MSYISHIRLKRKETDVAPGTKIITLYEHSSTGVICKPRAENLPLPSPDWFIVKFDSDGAKVCMHRSMMAVRNQ